MSRRAMIILILAIVAVHCVLLGLILATGSAERELNETLREIEKENELRSALETEMGEILASNTQKDSASAVQQQNPSGGQTASAALPQPTGDLPSLLPETRKNPCRPFPRPLTSASRRRPRSRSWISRGRRTTTFPSSNS